MYIYWRAYLPVADDTRLQNVALRLGVLHSYTRRSEAVRRSKESLGDLQVEGMALII